MKMKHRQEPPAARHHRGLDRISKQDEDVFKLTCNRREIRGLDPERPRADAFLLTNRILLFFMEHSVERGISFERDEIVRLAWRYSGGCQESVKCRQRPIFCVSQQMCPSDLDGSGLTGDEEREMLL